MDNVAQFWCEKRVLVTGHTGFKGGWLVLWLKHLGAHVTGIGLSPNTTPNLFNSAKVEEKCDSHDCDIRDLNAIDKLIRSVQPEVIFHLAAQPLVRQSYKQPIETFQTNIMGTANLLDAVRDLESVKSIVIVTTDKVYRNNEWHWPYREDDALGGYDPYSSSKAASELVIASFRESFLREQGAAVASARAGNVIGGGDWSLDRLVPDLMRAWQQGTILKIRRPHAIRPWQHVLEPLAGYLRLAEKLWYEPELSAAYNFGPQAHEATKVREVVELAHQALGGGAALFSDSDEGPHEAGLLALETARSRYDLGHMPKWSLAETVTRTVAWYQKYYAGQDARELCLAEIADYEKIN